MKIVYMGTPDFAVPALEKLAACEKHEVAARKARHSRIAAREHEVG